MALTTPVSMEVDLSDAIEMMNDKARVEWVTALLETIGEEGTIGEIRDLVNNHQWDDQRPADRPANARLSTKDER